MDHTFVSALVLLLLVLDPFGSLPIFISVLKSVAPERRRIVALREVAIAFAVLAVFMVAGQGFLQLMRLSERSLEVAGGGACWMRPWQLVLLPALAEYALQAAKDSSLLMTVHTPPGMPGSGSSTT